MTSQEPPSRGPNFELSGDNLEVGPAEESAPLLRTRRNPFTGRVTYTEARQPRLRLRRL